MKHKVKRIHFVVPVERSSMRCRVGRRCGNADEKAVA
jgi:hypothetical protein